MMDDDDVQSSGLLSTVSAWQLGKWSAEAAHRNASILERCSTVSISEYNAVVEVANARLADYQTLKAEHLTVKAQLRKAQAERAAFEAWGDRVAADRDAWKLRAEESREEVRSFCGRARSLREELKRLKGES